MNELTAERVKELLDYDPDTGVFTWGARPSTCVRIGDVAGFITPKGYRSIRIDKRNYFAHRLAFLVSHDRWPVEEVDHINGARDDNRMANLREVTHRENQQNRVESRNGKLCGAYKHHRVNCAKPWESKIFINGRFKHLGYFETEQGAHNAYMLACEAIA